MLQYSCILYKRELEFFVYFGANALTLACGIWHNKNEKCSDVRALVETKPKSKGWQNVVK